MPSTRSSARRAPASTSGWSSARSTFSGTFAACTAPKRVPTYYLIEPQIPCKEVYNALARYLGTFSASRTGAMGVAYHALGPAYATFVAGRGWTRLDDA